MRPSHTCALKTKPKSGPASPLDSQEVGGCCRTSALYSISISVAFDETQPVYINSIYSRILNACLDRMGDFYSAIAVVVAIATENKTDFPRRKRAK